MKLSKTPILTPPEELDNLKAIFGEDQTDKMFSSLTVTLDVLQNRSQMLLSLITITLTITGFSGPQIAASSLVARISIAVGLGLVLISALLLILGPLHLTWATRIRSGSIDQSLIKLIEIRNFRTSRFHTASVILVVGLTGYVVSVISFLVTG